MSDKIIYTRQPDGTYVKTGELPKGTKYATCCSSADARDYYGSVVKSVSDWVAILDRGPLKQEWYKLTPVASKSPKKKMSEETKEYLRNKKQEQKAALAADNVAASMEQNP